MTVISSKVDKKVMPYSDVTNGVASSNEDENKVKQSSDITNDVSISNKDDKKGKQSSDITDDVTSSNNNNPCVPTNEKPSRKASKLKEIAQKEKEMAVKNAKVDSNTDTEYLQSSNSKHKQSTAEMKTFSPAKNISKQIEPLQKINEKVVEKPGKKKKCSFGYKTLNTSPKGWNPTFSLSALRHENANTKSNKFFKARNSSKLPLYNINLPLTNEVSSDNSKVKKVSGDSDIPSDGLVDVNKKSLPENVEKAVLASVENCDNKTNDKLVVDKNLETFKASHPKDVISTINIENSSKILESKANSIKELGSSSISSKAYGLKNIGITTIHKKLDDKIDSTDHQKNPSYNSSSSTENRASLDETSHNDGSMIGYPGVQSNESTLSESSSLIHNSEDKTKTEIMSLSNISPDKSTEDKTKKETPSLSNITPSESNSIHKQENITQHGTQSLFGKSEASQGKTVDKLSDNSALIGGNYHVRRKFESNDKKDSVVKLPKENGSHLMVSYVPNTPNYSSIKSNHLNKSDQKTVTRNKLLIENIEKCKAVNHRADANKSGLSSSNDFECAPSQMEIKNPIEPVVTFPNELDIHRRYESPNKNIVPNIERKAESTDKRTANYSDSPVTQAKQNEVSNEPVVKTSEEFNAWAIKTPKDVAVGPNSPLSGSSAKAANSPKLPLPSNTFSPVANFDKKAMISSLSPKSVSSSNSFVPCYPASPIISPNIQKTPTKSSSQTLTSCAISSANSLPPSLHSNIAALRHNENLYSSQAKMPEVLAQNVNFSPNVVSNTCEYPKVSLPSNSLNLLHSLLSTVISSEATSLSPKVTSSVDSFVSNIGFSSGAIPETMYCNPLPTPKSSSTATTCVQSKSTDYSVASTSGGNTYSSIMNLSPSIYDHTSIPKTSIDVSPNNDKNIPKDLSTKPSSSKRHDKEKSSTPSNKNKSSNKASNSSQAKSKSNARDTNDTGLLNNQMLSNYQMLNSSGYFSNLMSQNAFQQNPNFLDSFAAYGLSRNLQNGTNNAANYGNNFQSTSTPRPNEVNDYGYGATKTNVDRSQYGYNNYFNQTTPNQTDGSPNAVNAQAALNAYLSQTPFHSSYMSNFPYFMPNSFPMNMMQSSWNSSLPFSRPSCAMPSSDTASYSTPNAASTTTNPYSNFYYNQNYANSYNGYPYLHNHYKNSLSSNILNKSYRPDSSSYGNNSSDKGGPSKTSEKPTYSMEPNSFEGESSNRLDRKATNAASTSYARSSDSSAVYNGMYSGYSFDGSLSALASMYNSQTNSNNAANFNQQHNPLNSQLYHNNSSNQATNPKKK